MYKEETPQIQPQSLFSLFPLLQAPLSEGSPMKQAEESAPRFLCASSLRV